MERKKRIGEKSVPHYDTSSVSQCGTDALTPPVDAGSGIQVISRAAAILRHVADHPDGQSLGQLAAATGLARSTVQRIVDALEFEHFLQAGTGGVRPGWGLRRLGELAGPGVVQILRPWLFRLFECTQETVDLSTLAEGEVLFMDRFLCSAHVRAIPEIGAHYPAYAMANGKALLAGMSNEAIRTLYGSGVLHQLTPHAVGSVAELLSQLDTIRNGGFAYDLEEHAAGACAIGLPLALSSVNSPLAVSVVVPSERFDQKRAEIETALRRCQENCGKQI